MFAQMKLQGVPLSGSLSAGELGHQVGSTIYADKA